MVSVLSHLQRKPLLLRLTVLMTVSMAVIIVLSNVAGFLALRSTLIASSQATAMRIATDLVAPASASIRQSGQLNDEVKQAAGVIVEAVHPNGSVLEVPADAPRLVLESTDLASAGTDGRAHRRTGVDTTGLPYSVVSVPLEDTGYALVVARPLTPILDILRTERLNAFDVIVASILAAGLMSVFVARSGLRPVRQLTAAVEHVAHTRDFRPISVRHVAGDLATLASAFNQLLRSIAQMHERQLRLVADAGHELRTPLTSLTTNIELLSSDLRIDHLSMNQKDAVLSDVRGQLTELTNLVNDLVRLSRDDSPAAFRPLDLGDVVRAAVERVRRRGQDRVFDVQLDEFYLVGDAEGLERAVTNLLDNAVKWSPAGGTIRVRLQGNRLRVADSGPGIPEADVPYVFDRFFRGETARKTQGTGLGLSIVAKTIEDHGGSVEAGSSDDGGAEITLRLPGVTNREALPAPLILVR